MSSTDTSVSAQEVRDYLRELANAPRYLHVVCLRCGLIVDRRRKATDLRTPEALYERVMCGNCCARSVLGEVIFSFDGGETFYDYEATAASTASDLTENAQLASSVPNVGGLGAVPMDIQAVERFGWPTHDTEASSGGLVVWLRSISWGEVVLCAAAGIFGAGILVGLRLAIYVFAGAVGG